MPSKTPTLFDRAPAEAVATLATRFGHGAAPAGETKADLAERLARESGVLGVMQWGKDVAPWLRDGPPRMLDELLFGPGKISQERLAQELAEAIDPSDEAAPASRELFCLALLATRHDALCELLGIEAQVAPASAPAMAPTPAPASKSPAAHGPSAVPAPASAARGVRRPRRDADGEPGARAPMASRPRGWPLH